MGVENDIFWSETGSGFGEPVVTPPLRIPRSTPPPRESHISDRSHTKRIPFRVGTKTYPVQCEYCFKRRVGTQN